MAASRDVVSGAPAHVLRPAVSARACLEHLCRALASLGVGVVPTEDASRGSGDRPRRALTAETLRRAKFDHPDASAPLWRAIHDLFLVAAAGFPDPSVAADALARVRGDSAEVDREAEDATCAALARHHLAEAGYPRARDLARLPPRDGRSRPLLLALAWAVHRADVFARAHADAHAPPLASAAPGAPQSPLPPYPPDSAASPAAARAAAVPALALERAYFEDARAALDACRDEHDDPIGDAAASSSSSSASSASAARLGRRREPLPLAARAAARVRAEAARDAGVRAQTPIFAQRLWQTLSHVEALERARATRRRSLRDARREFAAAFGDPSSAPARTPLPSSAYEVLLSRDANARRKHAAAMEATMEARNAASDAVSAAETFYAWVESALELEDQDREEDEREDDERGKDEEKDDVRMEGEPSPSSNVSSDTNGRSRSLGDALRAVECAARRVGPALRSRRRGVEAVADAWARARRRAEEDDDEAERLAKRSERAANGLPKFETFLAVRRGGGGASEDDETEERLRRRECEPDPERRLAQENASLAGLAPAMFADATPPPEDVEAALIARGATLRKVMKAMNVGDGGGDGGGGVSSRVETRSRVSRSRSALGGTSSPEAPEEAAARLGELARASEAALARTRRRARTFLASRVEAVFGRDEEGDPAPAVYTGWSE